MLHGEFFALGNANNFVIRVYKQVDRYIVDTFKGKGKPFKNQTFLPLSNSDYVGYQLDLRTGNNLFHQLRSSACNGGQVEIQIKLFRNELEFSSFKVVKIPKKDLKTMATFCKYGDRAWKGNYDFTNPVITLPIGDGSRLKFTPSNTASELSIHAKQPVVLLSGLGLSTDDFTDFSTYNSNLIGKTESLMNFYYYTLSLGLFDILNNIKKKPFLIISKCFPDLQFIRSQGKINYYINDTLYFWNWLEGKFDEICLEDIYQIIEGFKKTTQSRINLVSALQRLWGTKLKISPVANIEHYENFNLADFYIALVSVLMYDDSILRFFGLSMGDVERFQNFKSNVKPTKVTNKISFKGEERTNTRSKRSKKNTNWLDDKTAVLIDHSRKTSSKNKAMTLPQALRNWGIFDDSNTTYLYKLDYYENTLAIYLRKLNSSEVNSLYNQDRLVKFALDLLPNDFEIRVLDMRFTPNESPSTLNDMIKSGKLNLKKVLTSSKLKRPRNTYTEFKQNSIYYRLEDGKGKARLIFKRDIYSNEFKSLTIDMSFNNKDLVCMFPVLSNLNKLKFKKYLRLKGYQDVLKELNKLHKTVNKKKFSGEPYQGIEVKLHGCQR